MISQHSIKQILLDTQAYWDHEGTPAHVRENFIKVIKCGTIAPCVSDSSARDLRRCKAFLFAASPQELK
jgi:hypothetical protein